MHIDSPDPAAAAPEDPAWSDWMREAQAGDAIAYASLLRALVPYLATIARGILGTPQDVDDAVQDILLTVHRVRHTHEPGRPLRPWVATIARRHCYDLLRARRRRPAGVADPEAVIASQPSGEDGPDQALARDGDARGLHAAMEALPAAQREAVRLMKLGGLSAQEAAERTGSTAGAVKVACHRAMQALKQRLGGDR